MTFEVAGAADYAGEGYDLVAFFDSFHDLGDPLAAARHAASVLAPGGTCMLVEPFAGDRVEDNLNPIGRLYYGFSTLVCTPGSLSQPGRAGLGTQAGEAALREVLQAGGFGARPPCRRDAAEPRPRGEAPVVVTRTRAATRSPRARRQARGCGAALSHASRTGWR